MNSREERAAARDQRRNLEVPPIVLNHGLGRADIIRSRSPSPAAPAPPPGVFNFPPAPTPVREQFDDAMATEEQLAALREQIRSEVRAEFRNETAAVAAAIPDAIRKNPETTWNRNLPELHNVNEEQHLPSRTSKATSTTLNQLAHLLSRSILLRRPHSHR